ncbi:MAG TPA: hypothetical protein VJL82_02735 [Rhizomicrobium sp.]|nr:hypothetical protein [Rhizomicrobium sp.]
MIFTVQPIFRHFAQCAIGCPNAVLAGSNIYPSRVGKVVRASRDNDLAGNYGQITLHDVIPSGKIVNGLLVMNFQGDRNIHISYRADPNNPRTDSEQPRGRFLIPTLGEVSLGSFVLNIELEVIGKKIELQ